MKNKCNYILEFHLLEFHPFSLNVVYTSYFCYLHCQDNHGAKFWWPIQIKIANKNTCMFICKEFSLIIISYFICRIHHRGYMAGILQIGVKHKIINQSNPAHYFVSWQFRNGNFTPLCWLMYPKMKIYLRILLCYVILWAFAPQAEDWMFESQPRQT